MNESDFSNLLGKLPRKVYKEIISLPENIKKNICEIRLNSGAPARIVLPENSVFMHDFAIKEEELKECFLSLCNRSVFAHYEEIKEGYLAVGYGCRAGICGRFSEGKPVEITSLNIRISHDVKNCAKPIIPFAKSGLLIAGPPSSGKTTILRDAVRTLSNNCLLNICVIDSREEISVGYDMGICTDCIINKDKAKGIETALRTMSPHIIAFDEIGTKEELESVKNSLNSGVNIITTAHAGSVSELKNREIIYNLLKSGAVKTVALLSRDFKVPPEIIKAEEILNENN